MSLAPFYTDLYHDNPFYDPLFDLSLPFGVFTTGMSPFDYDVFDYNGNRDNARDYGSRDNRGQGKSGNVNRGDNWDRNRRSIPVSERVKHTDSKIMTEREGDAVWRPASDVYETREAFIVHIDLPGVPREDISVDLRGRELVISGEAKQRSYEAATSRVRERKVGKFRKYIFLPKYENLDKDCVEAKYQDGLLEIKVLIIVAN
ncbi:2255_t:CDS:2 [Acaulospora morrowiae]|uniref:2255_t:CDS:1 n=1 Tax=Acaulospora morrowiae TaxID=94023 RepID=A0A9N9G1T4_9GLOM|nr:2255_t:CDS:2 [Acaulospora morrowiae]